MKRLIKFRVWTGKEYRYPPEIHDWDFEDCELFLGYSKHPSIIEQYTGKKDKNGKEIYENMILNNRYLVITMLTKYVPYDILNKDILDGGIDAGTVKITGEYQELSENEKGDIDKYLQQAKRKIEAKGVAFA